MAFTPIPKQAKRFTQLQLIATDFSTTVGETADADGVTNPTVTYEAFYNEVTTASSSNWHHYLTVPLITDKFYSVVVQGNILLQGETNPISRQFYHYAIQSGTSTSYSLEIIDLSGTITGWFWGMNNGFVAEVIAGDNLTLKFYLAGGSKDFTIQGIVKILST